MIKISNINVNIECAVRRFLALLMCETAATIWPMKMAGTCNMHVRPTKQIPLRMIFLIKKEFLRCSGTARIPFEFRFAERLQHFLPCTLRWVPFNFGGAEQQGGILILICFKTILIGIVRRVRTKKHSAPFSSIQNVYTGYSLQLVSWPSALRHHHELREKKYQISFPSGYYSINYSRFTKTSQVKCSYGCLLDVLFSIAVASQMRNGLRSFYVNMDSDGSEKSPRKVPVHRIRCVSSEGNRSRMDRSFSQHPGNK